LTIPFVISSIFLGCVPTGILVIPGKSTKDKSGTVLLYTEQIIGSEEMDFSLPASLLVN
jgi:hypothetical protein